MNTARYFKFGLYTMATFLMWLLVGSILSMAAPLLGATPSKIFDVTVNSVSSAAIVISLVIFYFHRRIFRRDVFSKTDTAHMMVLATTVFLPIFIYISCVSLIEQLIRSRYLSLAMLGDTLRHNFMVVVPAYFITLVLAGSLFAGVHFLAKKLFSLRKK